MTITIYDNKVQKSVRVYQNMDEGDIFNGCSSLSSLCEWSYQQMQTEYSASYPQPSINASFYP